MTNEHKKTTVFIFPTIVVNVAPELKNANILPDILSGYLFYLFCHKSLQNFIFWMNYSFKVC